MRLFRKAQEAPAENPLSSLSTLKNTIDTLEKRITHLESLSVKERALAKQNAQKDRRKAIAALQRKHMYDKQVERWRNTQATLEQQAFAIENAVMGHEAFRALSNGAKTIKHINNNMTLQNVDDVMEEVMEQMDVSNAIGDAMAQPLGPVIDEDDLNQELDDLQTEVLDEEFGIHANKAPLARAYVPPQVQPQQRPQLSTPLIDFSTMPKVPVHLPNAATVEAIANGDDEDIRNLIESMKMKKNAAV